MAAELDLPPPPPPPVLPAPFRLYMAALNRRQGARPPTPSPGLSPHPHSGSSRQGSIKRALCCSTAEDANDPGMVGKGCRSANLALADPSYVGQDE